MPDPAAWVKPVSEEDLLPVEHPGDEPMRERIASAAVHYLSHRPPGVPDDCVGFVWASFARAGITLQGSTADLWEEGRRQGSTHKRKLPRIGDVAFFDNTYDRNRNRRVDDPLTHVAIVLDVEPDGTVHLAHGGTGRGRTTMVMNLREPALRRTETGKEANSWLRRKRDNDPRNARYLSGELWRGFASFSEPGPGGS